jgi:hypothetical protein
MLSEEDDHDALKQFQELFSTNGVTAGSSPDSQPPTTESANFVNSPEKVTVLISKRRSRT